MKLKTLLLSMSVMASAPAFATVYYVSPSGAGSKDGSSWENAFGVEEFRVKAAANVNGDVYNFEGGLYDLSGGTVIFKTATGATLIGNADGERTVFSGDKNGNNNPDAADANRLIRFQTNTVNGDSKNAITVENIDFTCVYTQADDNTTNMGAFAVDNCGDVLVKNCRFYNNWAQGSLGGAAAYLYRSTVKFTDCMFYNNSANYKGGAIRIFSDKANKGITTFENCVIKNNKNYHGFGGAIFMGHGNSLNIVNSTITGNSAVSDGAAIYFTGYETSHPRQVRIVNSTIAGNVTSAADDAQIVSTQSAHLNLANSIITSDDAVAAVKFKGDVASEFFAFVSGGYNFVGNVIDAVSNELPWQDSDEHGDACTYSAIFGSNTLDRDNVIMPARFYAGATGAEVAAAVAEWGLPSGLDFSVDQLGNLRQGEVTPGAYAAKKESLTTGIADVTISRDRAVLVSLGAGLYAVDGFNGSVSVYNVNGALVKTAKSDEIDLSSLVNGLYIIQAADAIFKVIR